MKLPPEQHITCEWCGMVRAEHHPANLTDGVIVGKYLLICPTVIFKAKGYDVDGSPLGRGQR